MRVTLTGATGRIGRRLVAALQERGDEVTVLSRDAERARSALGVETHAWQPQSEPAPAAALAGRDGVFHLASEDVAQRWTTAAKQRLLASRELGTRNLVAGLRAAEPRPGALVSASAVGYYGPRGDEPIPEDAAPGDDFLAGICVAWEREAAAAEELGVRVARIRTGIVLDKHCGALPKMLPFFRLGVGGPVAGGRQQMPWIHVDDLVGVYLAALDGEDWHGAGQRRGARPGDQPGVLQGARPCAAPPGAGAGAGPRAPHAVRGDGPDRHHRPARRAGARAGAGLSLPPPRARRGASERARGLTRRQLLHIGARAR